MREPSITANKIVVNSFTSLNAVVLSIELWTYVVCFGTYNEFYYLTNIQKKNEDEHVSKYFSIGFENDWSR
jgi:hypothetical protein